MGEVSSPSPQLSNKSGTPVYTPHHDHPSLHRQNELVLFISFTRCRTTNVHAFMVEESVSSCFPASNEAEIVFIPVGVHPVALTL